MYLRMYLPGVGGVFPLHPDLCASDLSADELRLLLAAAYTRFYMRPAYLANYCRIRHQAARQFIDRLDRIAATPLVAGGASRVERTPAWQTDPQRVASWKP